MYVVSEITGKRYSTIEEAEADEKRIFAQKEAEEKAKKMAELDKAWEKVVSSTDEFVKIAEEIDPRIVVDVKSILEMMKMI